MQEPTVNRVPWLFSRNLRIRAPAAALTPGRNSHPSKCAEMAALTRDELIEILTEIVHAARARLSEARPSDGLKAAEMLAKMCGWNEPERVNVQSVEVKVDAALMEQLRAGYAEMSARRSSGAKLIGDEDRDTPVGGMPASSLTTFG